MDVIGMKRLNTQGLEFEVLCESDEKDNDGRNLYLVRFSDTGYEAVFHKRHIKTGKIKDRLTPSVSGVGCMGYINNGKRDFPREYSVWRSMIARCYRKTHRDYKSYGGKGVTVCKRWLRFDLFLEDLKNVDGYDHDRFSNGEIELDKDLKQRNIDNKVYSLETCVFLSCDENNRLNK